MTHRVTRMAIFSSPVYFFRFFISFISIFFTNSLEASLQFCLKLYKVAISAACVVTFHET